MLQIACCTYHASNCMLQIVCCKVYVQRTCCKVHVAKGMFQITCCKLQVANCIVFMTRTWPCYSPGPGTTMRTRLGLQCETPLRSYPLSFDPWPLTLNPWPLSLPLVPYPLVLFLSRNLGEGQLLVLGLRLEFNDNKHAEKCLTHKIKTCCLVSMKHWSWWKLSYFKK